MALINKLMLVAISNRMSFIQISKKTDLVYSI